MDVLILRAWEIIKEIEAEPLEEQEVQERVLIKPQERTPFVIDYRRGIRCDGKRD